MKGGNCDPRRRFFTFPFPFLSFGLSSFAPVRFTWNLPQVILYNGYENRNAVQGDY